MTIRKKPSRKHGFFALLNGGEEYGSKLRVEREEFRCGVSALRTRFYKGREIHNNAKHTADL